MERFWEIALGITGIGAVGAFVLLVLYRQWLKLPIFQQMTKEQQYSLFRLLLILIFVFAFSALLAFVVLKMDRTDANPHSTGRESIIYSQIEIAESQCFWEKIEKPYTVLAPIRNPFGEYWHFGGDPIGTPRQTWSLGSHQCWPLEESGPPKSSVLSEDPVFDITILNQSDMARVVGRFGIRPIAAWTSPKGPPFSGKLTTFDFYSLQVAGFEVGIEQWLALGEPVYLAPNAPYRYRLQLKDYCKNISRNESVIRLLIEVDQKVYESDEIYLGVYSVHG